MKKKLGGYFTETGISTVREPKFGGVRGGPLRKALEKKVQKAKNGKYGLKVGKMVKPGSQADRRPCFKSRGSKKKKNKRTLIKNVSNKGITSEEARETPRSDKIDF